jgi:ubiquinone biosynthesis O-methyltransferase
MNPLRHDFIQKCQKTYGTPPAHELRFLDIGCGGGIFAESAARLPSTKSVTAIDPTPGVLAIAEAHKKRDPSLSTKLTYLNTAVEGLPEGDMYDVVSVFEVIEHVTSPAAFLDEVEKHVRPGGWLVMSTIARTWMSWFTTNLVAEDILGIVPKGTHDWEKYINVDELEKYFVTKGGWSKAVVQGVVYVPGVGWREIEGSEKVGNYFLGVRRDTIA